MREPPRDPNVERARCIYLLLLATEDELASLGAIRIELPHEVPGDRLLGVRRLVLQVAAALEDNDPVVLDRANKAFDVLRGVQASVDSTAPAWSAPSPPPFRRPLEHRHDEPSIWARAATSDLPLDETAPVSPEADIRPALPFRGRHTDGENGSR